MIKAHWYKSENAGDTLTPFIVKFFTGKDVEYVDRNQQGKLLGVGSIMKAVRQKDVVWGTGIMRETDTFKNLEKTIFLAVRGRMTADKLRCSGASVPEIYGDPALLLPFMYRPKSAIKYKVGLIPHYVENKEPVFARLEKQGGHIIDIKLPWEKVVDEILSCEYIISSSLHGIIIAEAYGVNAQWLLVSDKVLGNGFKFKDYLTGTGRILGEPNLPIEGINDFKALYTFPPIDPFLLKNIQDKLINQLKNFYA